MAARPLTDGEIRLARSIFADSIDYAAIRIHDRTYLPGLPAHTAMAPNGQIYMAKNHRPDYAAAPPHMQAFFLHEMTHVWQYQNNIFNPVKEAAKLSIKHRFNYDAAYPYMLDAAKDLMSYNMEQQASIVEDYFYIKVTGNTAHLGKCRNSKCTVPERLALYRRVLGAFHANPAYARRAPKKKGNKPPFA